MSKTAVFTPMPTASAITAGTVKPGDLMSRRKANFRSWITAVLVSRVPILLATYALSPVLSQDDSRD
jgi:hypothetical protein